MSGEVFVDLNSLTEEERKVYPVRMKICDQCEHKNHIGICQQCGCVLAIKARIPIFHCPIGKW